MDNFLVPYLNTILFGIICALLVLWYYGLSRKLGAKKEGKKIPPEARGGWPILGHLPLFRGPTPSHKTFGALADESGPIFTIRLGSHPGLVVSNSQLAKECFTANDLVVSSRPKLIVAKHLGYNYAMFGLAPHGPFWREIRKIATLELLSNRRLELLKHIRVSEVAMCLKELHKRWSITSERQNDAAAVLVDMKQWFWDLNLNVILRMLAGKRYSAATDHRDHHINGRDDFDQKEGRRIQKAIKEILELSGVFVPGDSIPCLRWLDLGGHEKAMKKTGEEVDGILREWIEEHKRKRRVENSIDQQQDFMDVMLNVLQGSDLAGYDADTIIKATLLNLIVAGSDTTVVTLTWTISLLLNNRHVLKKAQEELDSHVGKSRTVNESDITKLAYLHAIVKETLRLYPPAPLSAPHVFTEDCTIGGYHVSKGTRLLTNLWKIQTDPTMWPDPFEFKPERFLTTHKNVDVWGRHFELIPFGSGRRICPASNFAIQMLHFTLARLLQAFDITTPSNAPIDMTESFGLTNMKETALEVLITPRLSAELYG